MGRRSLVLPPRHENADQGTRPPSLPFWPIDPTPQLALFDLDDTLCDYAAARDARLRRAFLGAGAESVPPARLDAMVTDSIGLNPHGADHFPELFRCHGIADPERAEEAMAWYRRNRFHGLRLNRDARPTLSAVRSYRGPDGRVHRRAVGLVTNGPTEVQRAKIALLGLETLVDFWVISGEFGFWKPDRRIFAEALRQGGAEPGDAVFVGDSAEHDVAGAQAAGIRTIWINPGGGAWGSGPPPDRTVADLRPVPSLLASSRTEKG